MKKISIIWILCLITSYSYSQMLASQNKSAGVDVLPENPEKINKILLDTKMNKVVSEKTGILTSHSVTFYTTAFYKYTGSGVGGKVGQQGGYILDGVSDETFQAIADETGAYFEQKLKEFGYTIEDYNNFLEAKNFDKLKDKAEEPKVEKEVTNPNYTKKVKARTFTRNNQPVYPDVVGNTLYFKLVPDMKSNAIITSFDINFLSFGQSISNNRILDTTTGQMLIESSIHGGAKVQILTPKLKYGVLSTTQMYGIENTDGFEGTGEIKDGFFIVKADEAKYKKNCITLINRYTDLVFKYMSQL